LYIKSILRSGSWGKNKEKGCKGKNRPLLQEERVIPGSHKKKDEMTEHGTKGKESPVLEKYTEKRNPPKTQAAWPPGAYKDSTPSRRGGRVKWQRRLQGKGTRFLVIKQSVLESGHGEGKKIEPTDRKR